MNHPGMFDVWLNIEGQDTCIGGLVAKNQEDANEQANEMIIDYLYHFGWLARGPVSGQYRAVRRSEKVTLWQRIRSWWRR